MNWVQPVGKFVLALAGVVLALGWLPASARGAEAVLAGGAGVARMQAARDEVSNVRSNIVLTLLELYRIKADRDPAHPPFRAFTNQLDRMEGIVQAFARRAGEMKQKGNAYFADWEIKTAAIQDPDRRAQSERRCAERKQAYDEINRFMQEARGPFLAYTNELTKLKALLQGERNPQTIAQAEEAFMQANWRCVDVQRALMEVESRFDRLAASFAKDLNTAAQH